LKPYSLLLITNHEENQTTNDVAESFEYGVLCRIPVKSEV